MYITLNKGIPLKKQFKQIETQGVMVIEQKELTLGTGEHIYKQKVREIIFVPGKYIAKFLKGFFNKQLLKIKAKCLCGQQYSLEFDSNHSEKWLEEYNCILRIIKYKELDENHAFEIEIEIKEKTSPT